MTQALRGLPPELSAIQAPVRDPLDRVGDEIKRIVLSDFSNIEEVNEHLLFMRGKLFRPTLLLLSSRVGGEAPDGGPDARRGRRAGAPGHARPRRRGRSLGPAARPADRERPVDAPGRDHHGGLPVLAGRVGAREGRQPRRARRSRERGQRDVRRRDEAADVVRRARFLGGRLLPAHRRQDGVPDVGGVRDGCAGRGAGLPRTRWRATGTTWAWPSRSRTTSWTTRAPKP